ncbi:Lipocalin domain containing protein [Pandoravirus salinus]|uniref:Lipocalin domain containing protein n=1 Tax=Pandoravirus salinus TaxID=1349410 RepID=S4VXY3_9VIRU|nr:Lipocalin superfamily domain [Pandoravirus salinus]AGO85514.1 Lipocalin domain containing protein [Pandoravirus salinus]
MATRNDSEKERRHQQWWWWWQGWWRRPVSNGSGVATIRAGEARESPSLLTRLLAPAIDGGGAQDAVGPRPVDVDWLRWAGTWYEMARLPTPYERACTSVIPQATYMPRPDSPVIDVVNQCGDRRVRGVAHPVSAGRLWVDFGPGSDPTPQERALGNYVVLYVDSAYSKAIVATPDLQSAWALSRYACPEPGAVDRLVERMRHFGIDTSRLTVNRPAVSLSLR